MKLASVLVVAVLATLAKAIDFSHYTPKNIYVQPNRPGTFSPRIVGGEVAAKHAYPHAVALYNGEEFLCGGSILRKDVILTAAHCLDVAQLTSVKVVAGAHNLSDVSEVTRQSKDSDNFIKHEKWDPVKVINDVAVIILEDPLVLNNDVKAITLDGGTCDGKNLAGTEGTVHGWGQHSDNSPSGSPVLMHVTSKIITNAECKLYFGNIIADHICLDGKHSKGACSGDSGGALIQTRGRDQVQVGVVSFGSDWGCEWGFPTAYARVACFKTWIEDKYPLAPAPPPVNP